MHLSESGGDRDEHFDRGQKFSDKNEPRAFFTKRSFDFCELVQWKNFHARDKGAPVSSREFVEDDVADGVTEGADERDGDKEKVATRDEVSRNDVKHLARRKRNGAVRNHQNKNTKVSGDGEDGLDGGVGKHSGMITEMEKQISKTASKKYVQFVVLVIFLILNIFIWSATLRADRHGELTVAFLDVGQGDAIYMEAPNGNQMLIDGGPSSGAVLRALGRVMPFYDRSIDLVLATHPDQDHVGGLPAVIDRMNVATVVATENTSDTGVYGAFEKAILDKRLRRVLARAGERIILDDGVALEILFPDRNAAGWETNTASIVARLLYGNKSFLLTGDSPQGVEQYLVGKNGSTLYTTVLKLGHHGSRTSSSHVFLSAVDPEYVVISAGKDNKYGHPHKEVLDLLSEFKVTFFSTIDHGTIIFKTDGDGLSLK